MADYFEVEQVVRDYDSRITARILSYLKPYKNLVVLMICALAVSTMGELFVPVIQQRLTDNAIMARFIVIDPAPAEGLSRAAAAEREKLMGLDEGIEAGNLLFIPQGRNTIMTGSVERELKAAAVLQEESWYAFRYKDGDALASIVEERSGIFLRGEGCGAIKNADLYKLPVSQIRIVRAHDISSIVRTVLLLLCLLLAVFVFTFIQTWVTVLIGQKVMKDIRLALFEKTLSQSTDFLSHHPVGRIVTRLTGDVETINEFFTSVLVAFLKDLSVMIGALITLFVLSPRLALVVLCTMPPVMGITAISRIKARDAFRQQRIANSRVNSYLSEHLSGIQVVQLFRAEEKSRREFRERNMELLKANLGEMFVFATFRPIVEWFSTFTVAAVIAVGSNMVFDLSLSLGVLIAFIGLVSMFYNPVMDIAEKYTLLQSAMAGGERVFGLLDAEEKIPEYSAGIKTGRNVPEASPYPDFGGKYTGKNGRQIEFRDVHFSYKKGEEILKGLSFTVNPGETAAIVGYTGAGKTTIINVLTRLWDIDSGGIFLDGIPVKELPLAHLRRSVIPVLQDVFLFSGTVADNIRLGLPLTDEEVEAAARAVHAHEFISALKEGYRTILSEGASNISAGQRQLLSFARVIAHNPGVVILDEATSSIDTETERLIQLGMRRVLSGRSSIVIAHRLSTIRNADRILVLSGGRLIEEGNHGELIRQNGMYAGLYRLQYEEEA
ncbi:MAG: ABC transporter ATP-binding protein/permease [Treponema sp.]|nr:ABC transporter ATP-binding protein/permease [Treponema sp.]